jgi:biopolymer transport protein ExbD
VRRAAAAASLVLLACAARAPAPPPPAAATKTAAPAQTPPPGAVTPPAATEERLAAIERCRQGYARLGAIANVDPTSLAAELARGCADIFSEPGCAAAMRNAPADPAQFASTLARACRDAYCPRLPAPRPRLCERRELPPPTELLGQWGELHQQIMARELGIAPEALAPLFQPVTIPAAREVSREAPTSVHVHAKPEGSDRMRVWIDGGKAIVVPQDGSTDRLAALARDARAHAEGANVVFSVDKKMPYGVVIALIDAFKQQGFTRFAFSVERAPEKTTPSP